MLTKLAPYVLAVAGVIGVFYGGYNHGVNVTNDQWKAEWAKRDVQDLQAKEQFTALARATEQAATDAIEKIDEAYAKGQEDANSKAQAVIDSLKSDNSRLRKRFTCTSTNTNTGGLSTAADSTSQHHGQETGGLQREDAAFLIRESERADTVTRQLSACQQWIDAVKARF